MKANLRWFVSIALALLVIISAPRVPVLHRLDAFTTEHRAFLLPLFWTLFALSTAVCLAGVIYGVLTRGTPMSHEDVEKTLEQGKYRFGGPALFSAYRIRGTTTGARFDDQASFRDLKEAWRTGRWWKEPRWRTYYLVLGGGLTMGLSIFAVIVVIAPLGVKVLAGGAMLYAATRLIWAFARA